MGKIANKQVICEVLMEPAKTDQDIVALCSDSRGSASFAPFASAYPKQFVETDVYKRQVLEDTNSLMILLGTEMMEEDYQPFMDYKGYMIVLDGWCEEMAFDGVLINNTDAACNAVEYPYSLYWKALIR